LTDDPQAAKQSA